ncbi:MAG: type II toxin-antitoxin system mRNA interferase toxin, RelE/StbE family [Candidatus Levybacteria bacterium]|nr:type II toxin-antitoxin system mRNA interferase toxin, RelE/StbE family [Candidatus Levybacteria bacterium]
MKISKIHYTSRFIKDFKKISKDKQRLAIIREEIFRGNCFDSRLKTHKLTGALKDYWAFSVTHSDRILFGFISEKEIIFYKIGSHEIYR